MYRKMLYALIELQFNLDFNFLTFKWDAKTMSIARLLDCSIAIKNVQSPQDSCLISINQDWLNTDRAFQILDSLQFEIGLEKKPYITKIKTHGLIFCHYAFYIPVLCSSKQQIYTISAYYLFDVIRNSILIALRL